MKLSSVSGRMRLIGAQYLCVGAVLGALVFGVYPSVAVAIAFMFALAVSAIAQILIHEKLLRDPGEQPTAAAGYERESRLEQRRRLRKAFLIQLPVIAALLIGQLFLFNWLSDQSDSDVRFGAVFLALVAGSFVAFGGISSALGIRLGHWEGRRGLVLLEQTRPRQGTLPRRSAISRTFIDAESKKG